MTQLTVTTGCDERNNNNIPSFFLPVKFCDTDNEFTIKVLSAFGFFASNTMEFSALFLLYSVSREKLGNAH